MFDATKIRIKGGKWAQVHLTVPGQTPFVYDIPEQLGAVLGVRRMRGRIVLTTQSGIPMIVRREEGMEAAIISVRAS